jgi:hypothetical protein
MVKLNIKERYKLGMYIQYLDSTIQLRSVVDELKAQIILTPEELNTYEVKFDEMGLEVESTNEAGESYVKEIVNISSIVTDAIKRFNLMVTDDMRSESPLYDNLTSYFAKLLDE